MGLVQKEVQKVYMYKNGQDIQIRPTYKPRTFTISWTEQSNMSSGWTYSDDAAGLTAGDTAFDEFFGYSAVALKPDGTEKTEVTQEDSGGAGKLNISSIASDSYGLVMIKFPVRGIKMTKSGSVVTLSITDGLGREAEGYQYYAHCTGSLSNPGTPNDAFYMGAYKGYVTSTPTVLSTTGVLPLADSSSYQYGMRGFITYSKSNGSGFNIEGFYQRQYINALYMMKYGNPYSQNIIGTGRNMGTNTGLTNSLTDATGSVLDSTTQTYGVRLFGLEDRWGQGYEYIGGAYRDNSDGKLYTALSGWTGTDTDISNFEDTGVLVTPDTYGTIQAISGTNKGMFVPLTGTNGTDRTVYYTDIISYNSYGLLIGGGYNNNANGGVFALQFNSRTTSYSNQAQARLMYMNGLT